MPSLKEITEELNLEVVSPSSFTDRTDSFPCPRKRIRDFRAIRVPTTWVRVQEWFFPGL